MIGDAESPKRFFSAPALQLLGTLATAMAAATGINRRRATKILAATKNVLGELGSITGPAELRALLEARGFEPVASAVVNFIAYLRKNYPVVTTGTWTDDGIRTIFRLYMSEGGVNAVDPMVQAIASSPQANAVASRRYNATHRKEAIKDMCVRLSTKQWHQHFGLSRLAFAAVERRLSYFLLPSKHATLSALTPRETLLTALFYCRSGKPVAIGRLDRLSSAWLAIFESHSPTGGGASPFAYFLSLDAGGRLTASARAMYVAEQAVRGSLAAVDQAITDGGYANLFSTEPLWQQDSAAANAHFLGIRNAVVAVDSFSVECSMPPDTTMEQRRWFFCGRFGPALKATVYVDAFGIIRQWRSGLGYSVSDSSELRASPIGRHALSVATTPCKLLLRDSVIIGDAAYPLGPRLVTRFGNTSGVGSSATPKEEVCMNLALDAARQVVERTIRHLEQFMSMARSRGHSIRPKTVLRNLRICIFFYNYHRWSQLRDEKVPFAQKMRERVAAGRECERVRLPLRRGGVDDGGPAEAGQAVPAAAAAATASSASSSAPAESAAASLAAPGAVTPASVRPPTAETTPEATPDKALEVNRAGKRTRDALAKAITAAVQHKMTIVGGKARWRDVLPPEAGFPLDEAADDLSNVDATFMKLDDTDDEAGDAVADLVSEEVTDSEGDEELAAAIVASLGRSSRRA